MEILNKNSKRVVVVRWKSTDDIEVFSNLKNFCLNYPRFNYNTLNNYLSKAKVPFSNTDVYVERKNIIAKPKQHPLKSVKIRQIAAVVNRLPIRDVNNDEKDLIFWLSQPVSNRGKAVTFLIMQTLKQDTRLDKTIIKRVNLNK